MVPSLERERCSRCEAAVNDGDSHVWLEVKSADLSYELVEEMQLYCRDCYDAYRTFAEGEAIDSLASE